MFFEVTVLEGIARSHAEGAAMVVLLVGELKDLVPSKPG